MRRDLAVVAMIVLIVVAFSSNILQAPGEQRALKAFAVLVAGLYVLRFGKGLGFVPGLFAATPVAAVALGAGWQSPRRRAITAVAPSVLPFMWMFQFVGGAAPQWGGRYELTTTMLLLFDPARVAHGNSLHAAGSLDLSSCCRLRSPRSDCCG